MSNFLIKKSVLPIKNYAKKLTCKPCTCSNCPNGCQTAEQITNGTRDGRSA